MPVYPRRAHSVPGVWTAFGHSYLQYAFGTFYQTGRADSIFRDVMDVEGSHWHNYCVNGARAATEGTAQGGFNTFLQRVKKPQRGGPYVSDGGALLLCYGINDMGYTGVTTQIRTGFIHAMRTMISMWRASVIYENSFQVGTRTTYGAGFSSVAATYASGGTVHWDTDTTPDADDLFTLTLPSDYGGEPVSICLVGSGGVAGGTVTWSGTAGVTGTTSTSDIMPSAAATHCPVIKRITNLTSANAGQTIIGTVTQMDSGGAVMLDCWWLEAKNPQPVIVCNIAKLTSTGYAIYTSWTGTEAQQDADVDTWNTDLTSLVAEFDGMVQIADMDTAVGKATGLFADGLHPDELGAARIADACKDAVGRLIPNANSPAINLNPSAPRVGNTLRPHISGQWYTADYQTTIATGVVTTIAAAGSLWAIPVWVTQPREFWTRLAMRVGSTAGSASTIRWGLYTDVGWTGYPCELYNEATAASGALSTGTTANAVIMSPTSGNGSISWVLDPGLYWLAMLTVTAGASQTWVQLQGNNWVMPNVNTSGQPIPLSANMVNGWKATGVTPTTSLPATFPAGATATLGAPYIGVQVSINATN